ncbi:hypothetical protein NW762_003287 [Fusarium torreyae]|uniref:Uncharacterized protein n=1 Tax=Fusarium torreyae TaxID=1237075 RepID=A0A9W8VIR9_9HYPO|nr:hypothetical protein NW762_003287 [Fusarium torreyae]
MLNRGQAMILGPTKKRKSSTYTDEDQWFDVYRMVSPSYDPSVDKVSPYHESNMTSLDTLNTESSNGLSQIVDHFSKPLAGSELQELATDVDNILKNPDPEVRKALLLAKFDEQPVKRLKKLNEDRLKPVYSYGMQGDGSHEKVKAAENSSEQVPTVARPIARLFVWDNQEDFGNL